MKRALAEHNARLEKVQSERKELSSSVEEATTTISRIEKENTVWKQEIDRANDLVATRENEVAAMLGRIDEAKESEKRLENDIEQFQRQVQFTGIDVLVRDSSLPCVDKGSGVDKASQSDRGRKNSSTKGC